jgi:hypothetical protein
MANQNFLMKLVRYPRSLAPTLVTLPSMSLIPFAPLKLARLPACSLLPLSLMPVRLGPFYLVRPLRSILSFYFLLSSGEHDGLRLFCSKPMFSPASDATTRSRTEPRGRERHGWAKPRGRMELWEKRHRRQSREGSGEEAGTRPSFKQAGATESKLTEFNDSPIVSTIAQSSNT